MSILAVDHHLNVKFARPGRVKSLVPYQIVPDIGLLGYT